MLEQISIIGLGKLGASMAAAIASRGINVIGVDVKQETVDLINEGHAPVQETNLEETIQSNKQRIKATTSFQEAIEKSEIGFVIVPTPSDENGAFSIQYAASAFKEIGKSLATRDTYFTVVLTSTVLPGSLRYGLIPILECESKKKCGKDFGVCYSPEFIALGSVIHDFLHPDFTLVGEFDAKSGDVLEKVYEDFLPNQPPCMRMSLENAELTKISVNTYVTTKISFANMLAEICQKLPGGNVDVVTQALGMDSRIGLKYIKGGIGYGGPCFPRDNIALNYISNQLGVKASLAEITDQYNREIPTKLVNELENIITNKLAKITVLGLAYKPFSHVIEESQGFQIAKTLSELGYNVIAYDPLATNDVKNALSNKVTVYDSIQNSLSQANYVLITTPDPEFKELTINSFPIRPVTVIDCWRILQKELENQQGVDYLPLGIGLGESQSVDILKKLWEPDI